MYEKGDVEAEDESKEVCNIEGCMQGDDGEDGELGGVG